MPQQTKALDALGKVREELFTANNARAADLAAALLLAKTQAKALEDKLAQLGAKPPAQSGDQHGAKPADQHGSKPADQQGAKPADQHGSKPAAQNGSERKELAEEAADDARRLADQLGARELVKGDPDFAHDVREIQGMAQNRQQLAVQLQQTPATPDQLATVTQRVADRLETAYEATLAAKRLFAAQREECPPQYRQLVNRYFEALSKQEK